MKATFVQLSAVLLALIVVVAPAAYGIAQGFLSDGFGASWAGRRVVMDVVEHVRADPCNNPDVSTTKATLTTVDGAREILAERWD